MKKSYDCKPGLMDTADIEFGGRTLLDCVPRYCNGKYMMLEYEYAGFNEGSFFIVSLVKYDPIYCERTFLPLAIFALRSDAMAWIHKKEGYSRGSY